MTNPPAVPAYSVTPFRWAVLGTYMFVTTLTQVLWINFAAINSISAAYFGVTTDDIDLLSMIFMLVYIALAIPSAWLIDTRGIKLGAGLGAVLTGAFGLLRSLAGANYPLVFLCQTGIAVGQPFVLNAAAKLSAQWFPEGERAIATGLGSMAMFLGVLLGMLVPPLVTEASGFEPLQYWLGGLSVAAAVAFLLVVKEKPLAPPGPAAVEEKTFVREGVAKLLRTRDFQLLMVFLFIGLGGFNAIATWIEAIVAPRGFNSLQAGITGALIVVGGIVGTMVLTTLSDKVRKRKIFLVVDLGASVPFLLGVVFVTSYGLLLAMAFLFGFFTMSALPIALQFAAEQTAPVPEGTSSGVLMMMGQVGGVVLIVGFLGVSDMTGVMVFIACLFALAFGLCFLLKEEKEIGVAPSGTTKPATGDGENIQGGKTS